MTRGYTLEELEQARKAIEKTKEKKAKRAAEIKALAEKAKAKILPDELGEDLTSRIDVWAKANNIERIEAIRQLIERGLERWL